MPAFQNQSEIDIEIALTDKQSQFERAVERSPYTLYGGAKGGGKSHGLRSIMLFRRLKYAGSTGYIFRRTYPELERNHITPLFRKFPELKQFYNATEKSLKLPNGSDLRFAFVKHRADLEKFQGLDTHDLAIEEAGEWPWENFEYLDTQKRTAIAGISARTILTGNPGGLGHQWLKRLFITKNYRGAERATDYAFVPALVDDNPFLMQNDPDYVRRLEAISNEALRKAFRYGSWDISAGQFFSDFRRDIHVVKPFTIPPHWKRYWGYDFGFNHPTAMVFIACDEDGNCFVYREFCRAQMHLKDQAEWIKALPEFKSFPPAPAGHDCWHRKFEMAFDKKVPDQGPTIAEMFRLQGVQLTQANINRIQGANRLRDYLRYEEKDGNRIGPRLYFFETCEQTIECVTRMTHNPDDVEDVLKVDADSGDPYTGDDLYDALRYVMMGRPSLSTKIPNRKKDAWADAFAKQSAGGNSWRTA